MYLEIHDAVKKIGPDIVLDHVDLSLEQGMVCGIQGENGSGKSMLMRAVCGLILLNSGTVTVGGKTIGREISFPGSLGALIENPGFLNGYTGYRNLKILADIRHEIGENEIRTAMERIDLSDAAEKKYRKYSLGMKEKLGIAAAIMERPELIVLDEPTNALDEDSRNLLWRIIHEERERGALVLVSCHNSDELEPVADVLYEMRNGKIREKGGGGIL